MKRILQNLALALGATLVSVIVMELGLRLYYYGALTRLSGEHTVRVPDVTRGWTLAPGEEAFQRSKDYAVRVRINDKGLRDREHPIGDGGFRRSDA